MLAKLVIELDNRDRVVNHQMASLFHGVIMEQVDREYGAVLHESALKPYSQCLKVTQEECVWEICTLTREAYEKIILPLMDSDVSCVEIKHHKVKVAINRKQLTTSKYSDLVEANLFEKKSNYITVKFDSPCGFKSEGEYVFYPSVKLLYQSLIRKFDLFCSEAEIYTPELMTDIEEHVKISRYHLRSVAFHMEGVIIPSFIGEVTLKVNGPGQLIGLLWLLLRFGEYSGVGIKSAIGMGSIQISEKEWNNERKTE